MFKRKISFFALSLSGILMLGILVFQPPVKFDYDFESFFPQDDEELSFYQEFRAEFGNDNDYLLIALGHKPDIFDLEFSENCKQFKGCNLRDRRS
jgi:uncharacterized protein